MDTDSEDHFVAVSANGYEVWVMKRSATESDKGAHTFGKIEVCEQPCHGSMQVFSALTPPTMTIDAGWSKAGSFTPLTLFIRSTHSGLDCGIDAVHTRVMYRWRETN